MRQRELSTDQYPGLPTKLKLVSAENEPSAYRNENIPKRYHAFTRYTVGVDFNQKIPLRRK